MIETKFLKSCIDMDTFQHSWHLNLDTVWINGSDVQLETIAILKNKIFDRKAELEQLEKGLSMLTEKVAPKQGSCYIF